MLLWLTTVALASGIMTPKVQFVDEDCTAYPMDEGHVDWPRGRTIRVTGRIEGTTSAPGGPSSQHVFALEPTHLEVRRTTCRVKERGRWIADGRCGAHPAFRWVGRLPPGEAVRVGPPSLTFATLQIEGQSRRASCPTRRPAPAAVDERVELSTIVEQRPLSENVLFVDRRMSRVELVAGYVEPWLGYDHLTGLNAHRVESLPDGPLPTTATVTTRSSRHRFDASDGRGKSWCEQAIEVQIDIQLPGIEADFSFGHIDPDGVVRSPGRCRN